MDFFKSLLFLILFSVINKYSTAQYITHIEFENFTENITEDTLQPSFIGGDSAFSSLINTQIQYPEAAKFNQLQGRVIVQITILSDSTTGEINVLRDIGGGCKEEVVRVIKLIPKWVPALVKGKPINSNYLLSVKFYCEYIEPPKNEQLKKLEIKNR